MKRFIGRCLDLFFPPHEDERSARASSEETVLEKLRLSWHESARAYTGLSYRDQEVRALIRANKFHKSAHAARILGAVLFEMLVQIANEHALDSAWKAPLLVPIPSSGTKRRERGYNQVEHIIATLSKEARQNYHPRLLKRHERESQAHLPKTKRVQNIRGAFFVHEKYKGPASVLHRASVILVDDVSESGATMKDAMRALKKAGARRVIGVALAK